VGVTLTDPLLLSSNSYLHITNDTHTPTVVIEEKTVNKGTKTLK